jgi:hypothetical protein
VYHGRDETLFLGLRSGVCCFEVTMSKKESRADLTPFQMEKAIPVKAEDTSRLEYLQILKMWLDMYRPECPLDHRDLLLLIKVVAAPVVETVKAAAAKTIKKMSSYMDELKDLPDIKILYPDDL